MRHFLVLALFLLSATAFGFEAASDPGAGIEVIDATPAFWTFWGAAEGKSEQDRIRLFMDIVVAAHPELFDASVLNRAGLTGNDTQIAPASIVSGFLHDVTPYIPRMQGISKLVRSDFSAYASDFKDTFPDFAPKSAVYFTVSLFSFDGATRSVHGRTALLFGIDGIARYHGKDESLKVLFDHELFHQYHDQLAPDTTDDDAPLWMSLWEEGLATYVSQRMNPGSTDAQVLMSDSLAALAKPLTPTLARELLTHFDSLDRAEYAAFFYANNNRPDLPPRCGYYVGYRIAQALATGRSLQQLALLRGPGLKAAIRQVLEEWRGPS